jgi:hypothetical protein
MSDELKFAKIKPGMNKKDVTDQLGHPIATTLLNKTDYVPPKCRYCENFAKDVFPKDDTAVHWLYLCREKGSYRHLYFDMKGNFLFMYPVCAGRTAPFS